MDDDKSWKDLADNLSVDGDGDEGSDSELNGLVDSIELTPRMNGKGSTTSLQSKMNGQAPLAPAAAPAVPPPPAHPPPPPPRVPSPTRLDGLSPVGDVSSPRLATENISAGAGSTGAAKAGGLGFSFNSSERLAEGAARAAVDTSPTPELVGSPLTHLGGGEGNPGALNEGASRADGQTGSPSRQQQQQPSAAQPPPPQTPLFHTGSSVADVFGGSSDGFFDQLGTPVNFGASWDSPAYTQYGAGPANGGPGHQAPAGPAAAAVAAPVPAPAPAAFRAPPPTRNLSGKLKLEGEAAVLGPRQSSGAEALGSPASSRSSALEMSFGAASLGRELAAARTSGGVGGAGNVVAAAGESSQRQAAPAESPSPASPSAGAAAAEGAPDAQPCAAPAWPFTPEPEGEAPSLGMAFGASASPFGDDGDSFFDALAGGTGTKATAFFDQQHHSQAQPQQAAAAHSYDASAYGAVDASQQPYWDGAQWVYPQHAQPDWSQHSYDGSYDGTHAADSYYQQQHYDPHAAAHYAGGSYAVPGAHHHDAAAAQHSYDYYGGQGHHPGHADPAAAVHSPAHTDAYGHAAAAAAVYGAASSAAAAPAVYDPSAYAFPAPEPPAPAAATPPAATPPSAAAPPAYHTPPQPTMFMPTASYFTPETPKAAEQMQPFASSLPAATQPSQPQHQGQAQAQAQAWNPSDYSYGAPAAAQPPPAPQAFNPYGLPSAPVPTPSGEQHQPYQQPYQPYQPGASYQHAPAYNNQIPAATYDTNRTPYGRPPCAIVSFGFGGAMCVFKPDARTDGRPGPAAAEITTTRAFILRSLRRQRQQASASAPALPFLSAADPPPHGGDADDAAVLEGAPAHVQEAIIGLDKFPGPLVHPLPAAKLKSLTEYLAHRAARSLDPDHRALYLLLELAASKGHLRTPGADAEGGLIERQVAAALASSGLSDPPQRLTRPPPSHQEDPEVVAREVQRLLLSGQKVEAALTAVRGGQHGIGALIASQLPPKARADVLAYVAQQAACPGTPLQGYLLVLAGRTALESHSAPVDVDKMLEAKQQAQAAASKDRSPPTSAKGRGGGITSIFSISRRGSVTETASNEGSVRGASPRSGGGQPTHPPPSDVLTPLGLAPSTSLGAALGVSASGPHQAEFFAPEDRWRELLSMLATSRPPGEADTIRQLADRLAGKGRTAAAHCCLLLAPLCLPGPMAPEERLCLLGSDHKSHPRTYASIDAIQRTEVLEWGLHSQGAAAGPQVQAASLAVQPYRVLQAWRLANAGRAQDALKYCDAVQAVLKQLKQLPPGLMICRDACSELEQRIRVHMGSAAPPVATGSLVGHLGRLIDRGISRLVGMEGSDAGGSPGPLSASAPGPGFLTPNASTGNLSGYGGPNVRTPSPSGFSAPSPDNAAEELNGPQGGGAGHQASRSWDARGPSGTSGTRGSTSGTAPPAPPSPSRREKSSDDLSGPGAGSLGGDMAKKRQGSISTIFGGIGSGLSGLLAPLKMTTGKEIKLGRENKFFYDEKLGIWREEGVEVAEKAGPPPPPPTSFGAGWGAAPPTAPPLHGQGDAAAGGLDAGASRPPIPPSARGPVAKANVRARYVDTFAHSNGGPAAPPPPTGLLPPTVGAVPLAPAPPGAPGLGLRPQPLAIPGGGTAAAPGAPSFFVPQASPAVGHSGEDEPKTPSLVTPQWRTSNGHDGSENGLQQQQQQPGQFPPSLPSVPPPPGGPAAPSHLTSLPGALQPPPPFFTPSTAQPSLYQPAMFGAPIPTMPSVSPPPTFDPNSTGMPMMPHVQAQQPFGSAQASGGPGAWLDPADNDARGFANVQL